MLQLLFITGLVFAALAWLYKRRALRHVSYERTFSTAAASEGDTIEMIERIANRKLLPLPWLRLESLLSSRLVFERQADLDIRGGDLFQNHISLFSLRPYRLIVRRHLVRCAARGVYALDSATMTAGDPFGFGTVSVRCPLSLQLLVYPKPLPLRDVPLPSHSWLGELEVKRWILEDPFLTTGVREYEAGDSFRSIHWKATARAGTLQVHKRPATADHRMWIALNVEISESMWKQVTDPPRIERAIRYAASIAQAALERGIETGLLCNAWCLGSAKRPVRIAPQGGSGQLELLLEAMARLELESVMMFADLLQEELESGESGADYLILTCHQADGMIAGAEALRRSGNGVEFVIVPDTGVNGGDEAYGTSATGNRA
ncbi:DUF58 domain-containing protein [Gordoniibacillus kamchatkensis]|uniref:DUF58 domain-containing protein n=1 Tax=Gordoniibacillus kamchatkensis TaxID=1590651 RepID=UPI000697279C|nr:DUF58 domain-containing protein [Paenibacillus sp. VKM B-2647]